MRRRAEHTANGHMAHVDMPTVVATRLQLQKPHTRDPESETVPTSRWNDAGSDAIYCTEEQASSTCLTTKKDTRHHQLAHPFTS